MEALNFAFAKEETRNFVRLNGTALLLTLGGIVGVGIAVSGVVALPVVVKWLGLEDVLGWSLAYVRWPVLAAGMVAALTAVYRYGPCRSHAARIRVSVGAIVATVLWLAGSWLFSFYVENFGQFNETYGSLGAIVILLFWLLLSAYAILLGAEIDGQLARRNMQPDEP
jgi:membrane protein